jgi:hypothetical protein
MDPELVKLVQQASDDQMSVRVWITALAGLLCAGLGAFLGAYLKKKADNLATAEDFRGLLEQVKLQTKATEEIRTEMQRELGSFGDRLERAPAFTGFKRERISEHMDQVMEAYVDIYALAQLIPLRSWMRSNTDLDAEARFRTSLCRLRVHFGALSSLDAISTESAEQFADADWRLLDSWNDVLGEAALRTPELRGEWPEAEPFSSERYLVNWRALMTSVESMGRVVKGLSGAMAIPQ